MTNEFDNLIRSAKPATSDVARQRVMAQVVPAFVAVVPLPWLRLAAALLAAFGAGFAAVAWLADRQPVADTAADSVQQLSQDVSDLNARLARLEGEADFSAQVAALQVRTDALADHSDLQNSLNVVVGRIVDQRNAERRDREMEAHRDRHLAYARSHYQQEVDRAVIAMKRDYRLTEDQEQQVRKVFQEHGKSAEALISSCYRGKSRQVSDEFEKLAQKTQGRLETLLSEVPRVMPGADLAEWGPNPDPSSLSDYETWVRWNEETSRQG